MVVQILRQNTLFLAWDHSRYLRHSFMNDGVQVSLDNLSTRINMRFDNVSWRQQQRTTLLDSYNPDLVRRYKQNKLQYIMQLDSPSKFEEHCLLLQLVFRGSIGICNNC
ncbi:hypothetical protein ACOSQ3_008247 [Xanthoceras sorbifolium]